MTQNDIMNDNSTSVNLSNIEFITYHILIRKLLDLSDKGEIVLGSAREQLLRLRGFCNYLTLGQKNTINLIVVKCMNTLPKEKFFKVVDNDFSPDYVQERRKSRQSKKIQREVI